MSQMLLKVFLTGLFSGTFIINESSCAMRQVETAEQKKRIPRKWLMTRIMAGLVFMLLIIFCSLFNPLENRRYITRLLALWRHGEPFIAIHPEVKITVVRCECVNQLGTPEIVICY